MPKPRRTSARHETAPRQRQTRAVRAIAEGNDFSAGMARDVSRRQVALRLAEAALQLELQKQRADLPINTRRSEGTGIAKGRGAALVP
jgi:hypothetical protein